MKLLEIDLRENLRNLDWRLMLISGDENVLMFIDTGLVCGFPAFPTAVAISAWDKTNEADLEW